MKTRERPKRTKTRTIRCAIYTRKSTEEGLDKDFTSLDAQRDAGESYVASQRHEGWRCLPDRYDDGGFTGSHAAVAYVCYGSFQLLLCAFINDCRLIYARQRTPARLRTVHVHTCCGIQHSIAIELHQLGAPQSSHANVRRRAKTFHVRCCNARPPTNMLRSDFTSESA